MNSINFNKNDFPLTSTVMNFLQDAILLIQRLSSFYNYMILSGCTTTGSYVSEGYVAVNGEIMFFPGGAIQTYVRVITNDDTVTIQDANYTKTTKQLEFGSGAGQIIWNNFKKLSSEIFQLAPTKIPIGSWDMNTYAGKQVIKTGIIPENVRGITVIINDDSGSFYELNRGGTFEFDSTFGEFNLERDNSGFFDNNLFSNSVNRGYILIHY